MRSCHTKTFIFSFLFAQLLFLLEFFVYFNKCFRFHFMCQYEDLSCESLSGLRSGKDLRL